MIYELRIYEAAPGRMADLNARFRDHTLRIFANHGLDVVGFWTYAHGGWSDQLVYLMKFEDMADRDRKWAAFRADEEWRQVRADSERDGAIVTRIRSDILAPTGLLATAVASARSPLPWRERARVRGSRG